jgi:CRP/FNR family transcriptional regulator, cyclic AMP receptor protein
MLQYCQGLPTTTVAAGEVMIEEGSAPGVLLVLASGHVTVERDGVTFARIDTPGAIFGEMSWVLGKSATATVRATDEVTLHVIDDPEDFFTSSQPRAALEVLRMTAARLDGLTQYLVDVKRQFADMEGHLGMVDRILDTLVHHQAPAARTGSVRDPEVC